MIDEVFGEFFYITEYFLHKRKKKIASRGQIENSGYDVETGLSSVNPILGSSRLVSAPSRLGSLPQLPQSTMFTFPNPGFQGSTSRLPAAESFDVEEGGGGGGSSAVRFTTSSAAEEGRSSSAVRFSPSSAAEGGGGSSSSASSSSASQFPNYTNLGEEEEGCQYLSTIRLERFRNNKYRLAIGSGFRSTVLHICDFYDITNVEIEQFGHPPSLRYVFSNDCTEILRKVTLALDIGLEPKGALRIVQSSIRNPSLKFEIYYPKIKLNTYVIKVIQEEVLEFTKNKSPSSSCVLQGGQTKIIFN